MTDRPNGWSVEGSVFAHLPRWTFITFSLLGAAFITASSLVYFDFETLPPFVIEKLPVRFEELWMFSLRAHVTAALITFPACVLLITTWLQRRVTLHRWVGRITGSLMLIVLVPSGAVLAFDAKGGPVVTVGFLLSGALVAFFLVRGVMAARRHDLATHRHAMWHVVAQMSVAVTSRAMLVGFDAVGVDPDLAYVVALWVPVLGSAGVVELKSFFERNSHEAHSSGVVFARVGVRVGR